MPDWEKMMREAPEIPLKGNDGFVYLIADSHLGDDHAPVDAFFEMLHSLPEARMVIFLGDLFKVWLGLPKFWDQQVKRIISGFEDLQASGVKIVFVVGNREYFLPRTPEETKARNLPFDYIIPQAFRLTWNGNAYGLSHGDNINRHDVNHLIWQWVSRSRWFEKVFRAMPGSFARYISIKLEKTLAQTNREIKIQYPLKEIESFAQVVMPNLDAFFVGHFHRDEAITIPNTEGLFRIVPDWYSRRVVLRLESSGKITPIGYPD